MHPSERRSRRSRPAGVLVGLAGEDRMPRGLLREAHLLPAASQADEYDSSYGLKPSNGA
ncbi:MAG: hypothetical protein ACLPVY_25180 [Acidimicrobiia bacterium]